MYCRYFATLLFTYFHLMKDRAVTETNVSSFLIWWHLFVKFSLILTAICNKIYQPIWNFKKLLLLLASPRVKFLIYIYTYLYIIHWTLISSLSKLSTRFWEGRGTFEWVLHWHLCKNVTVTKYLKYFRLAFIKKSYDFYHNLEWKFVIFKRLQKEGR